MRISTRLACFSMAVVLVASMSVAALAVTASGPSSSKAIEKLEPELRMQVMGPSGGASKATFNTIVFLEDWADVRASGKAMVRAGAAIKSQFDALGAFSAEMNGKAALDVASLDQVKRVFLDEKKYRLPAVKNEPGASIQPLSAGPPADAEATEVWWASTSAEMGAEDVWDEGVIGSGVLVAVLDTGCDIYQADLADAIVAYRSFTSEEFHDVDGHGTATAGLVGARGVNDYVIPQFDGVVKMKGMAPGANLMTGKVLDDTGYGWDSWIIGGIEWAITGDDGELGTGDEADIISMSLGGMEVPNDGDDPTSCALDVAAEDFGIVSFLSAGNEGTGQSTIGSAGVSRTTMTVGASTLNAECQLIKYWPLSDYYEQYLIVKEGEEGYENDHMIWFSSRGPTADGRTDPDICAAGAWGPSTQPGDTLEIQFGGTSMAAPVAAGVGALIIEAFADKNDRLPTPDEVRAIMMGTALDMGYGANEQGPGRVDALAAYEAVMAGWAGPGQTSVALTIPAGESASVEFADGVSLSSKAMVPSGRDGIYFSDICPIATDLFYEFEVEDGEGYVTIDLAFDQKYVFKRNVHGLVSTGAYTDTHLNVVLYRLDDDGERTLINYGYAHTNTQELNARVTPGTYELRVSPVIYRTQVVPFDAGIEFFKAVEWSWFSADGSVATVSVPSDAMAGVHTGFIETECEGVSSLVPVAVSVPLEVGKVVEDVMDVNHEIWGYNEGDWKYYFLEVPEEDAPAALTAVVDWSSWNTDIDTYWINPERRVVEASLTQYLGIGMFGPWETSSMDTADVLTVLDPEPGMWMFAMHVVLMDRVLEEPFTLVVHPYTAAEFGNDWMSVKTSKPATTLVINNADQTVGVGLMPVRSTLVSTTTYYSDWVSSIDQHGDGAVEVLFDIAPLTQSLTVMIDWYDEDADLDVVLYAADWSNAGILWDNGASVVIENPSVGEWDAAVALKNSAKHVEFVVTVITTCYEPWAELRLSAYSMWLGPDEVSSVTASLPGPWSHSQGMIVAYDLVTGCEYDTILVNGKP
jgi:subtilisin family serine protease